jgi:formyltetrahydrofolate synthetase
VVTEAGFGADLGAEKFIDIKCRKTGCGRARGDRGDGARAEVPRRRRMPGLPKVPSAEKIDLVDGKVVGLF